MLQYFAQCLAIKLAPYMKCTDCSIRVYQFYLIFASILGGVAYSMIVYIIILGFSTLIVANQLHFAQICYYYASIFALCLCIPIILKIIPAK